VRPRLAAVIPIDRSLRLPWRLARSPSVARWSGGIAVMRDAAAGGGPVRYGQGRSGPLGWVSQVQDH